MAQVTVNNKTEWDAFYTEKTSGDGKLVPFITSYGKEPKRYPCTIFYTGTWSPRTGTTYTYKFAY